MGGATNVCNDVCIFGMSYGICFLVYVSRSACEDVQSCFQDAQGSVRNEHYGDVTSNCKDAIRLLNSRLSLHCHEKVR